MKGNDRMLKPRRYVLSVAFLMSVLSVGGCQWDSSLYDEMNDALGNNEPGSCENIAYILERDAETGARIMISCNRDIDGDGIEDEDGVCFSEQIEVSPANAVTRGSADDYRHNFNYDACPEGYECKADKEASRRDGMTINYCEINCLETEHNYNGGCEADSLDHCGSHGNACAESVPGWVDGRCEKGQCVPTACDEDNKYRLSKDNKCVPSCSVGTHYDSDTEKCEADDLENCGQKGYSCADKVSNWANGYCSEGGCHVTECKGDYQSVNNVCVPKCGEDQYYDTDSAECKRSDDNNCGSKGYVCSSIIGWKSGECKMNKCVPASCLDGYTLNSEGYCISTALTCDMSRQHYFNGACEDNSLINCGGHGIVCSAETIPGWASGECDGVRCVPTNCKAGYRLVNGTCVAIATLCGESEHYHNESCEPDNTVNCGYHGNDCASIAGWKSGDCSNKKCVPSACDLGYTLKKGKCVSTALMCAEDEHYYNGECESDSVNHCGSHDVVCDKNSIPGWNKGSCNAGKCVASSCTSGYKLSDGMCVSMAETCSSKQHYYNGNCEDDSTSNCGAHGIECSSDSIPGWSSGNCSSGKCVATKCSSGYTLSDGKCKSTATTCDDDQHYYNGKCEKDDTLNCGHHGNECSLLAGWVKGDCKNKKCVATKCTSDYKVSSGQCVVKSSD